MESFFLSETAKYLYLLHSNASALPDFYMFSTEGHILPVLPSQESSHDQAGSRPEEGKPKHGNCKDLCRLHSHAELLQVRPALLDLKPSLIEVRPAPGSHLHWPIPIKDGFGSREMLSLLALHRGWPML